MAKYRIVYFQSDYVEIEAKDRSELRRKAVQCAPFDYDYYEVEDINEEEENESYERREEAPKPDPSPIPISEQMMRKMVEANERAQR